MHTQSVMALNSWCDIQESRWVEPKTVRLTTSQGHHRPARPLLRAGHRPLDGKHNGGDGRGSSLYHGIRPIRRAERQAASAGDRSPMTCGSGQRRCRRSLPHGNGLDGDGRLRSGSLHGKASTLRPRPKPWMDEHCLSGSGTHQSVNLSGG